MTEVQESDLAGRESTHHGTALVEINSVRLKLRLLLWLIWILKGEEFSRGAASRERVPRYPAIDLELLVEGFILCGNRLSNNRGG